MNGEFVCELVRAHNEGDDARFAVILSQIIDSESRRGSDEVADRLRALFGKYTCSDGSGTSDLSERGTGLLARGRDESVGAEGWKEESRKLTVVGKNEASA
jgi:hypothetical protein